MSSLMYRSCCVFTPFVSLVISSLFLICGSSGDGIINALTLWIENNGKHTSIERWPNDHNAPFVALANDIIALANIFNVLLCDPVPCNMLRVPGIPKKASNDYHTTNAS